MLAAVTFRRVKQHQGIGLARKKRAGKAGRLSAKEAERRRRRRRRERTQLFTALGVFLLLLASPVIYDGAFRWLAQPESAIDKGFDYFLRQEALAADSFMLLGQAALIHDEKEVLRRLDDIRVPIGNREWMDRNTAELARDRRMLPPSTPPGGETVKLAPKMADPISMTQFEFTTIFTVVGAALLCEEGRREDLDGAIARASDPSHGYVLAHQLWAMETLRRRGCVEEETVLPISRKLVQALASETGAQPLATDLHFERLAMLSYAGAAGQLADTFIPLLLDAQNPDGSWGQDETLHHDYGTQNLTREHASALALYALAAMAARD